MTLKRIFIIFVFAVVGCSGDTYPPVENALDAGRQFIDAIFKGNFKRAGMLILDDAPNRQLLKTNMEENFNKRTSIDRNELKQSSITIFDTDEVIKDSVTIIKFKNSYDNMPAVLKIIKQNDSWVVDLKYTFSGNL